MTKNHDSVMAEDTGDLEWTILDNNDDPIFKIVPYSNHLCYEIYKWDTTVRRDSGEEVMEWKSTGMYPSTLDHACNVIRDYLVMDCGVKTSDLTELKKAITRSTNQILAAVKEGFANGKPKRKPKQASR